MNERDETRHEKLKSAALRYVLLCIVTRLMSDVHFHITGLKFLNHWYIVDIIHFGNRRIRWEVHFCVMCKIDGVTNAHWPAHFTKTRIITNALNFTIMTKILGDFNGQMYPIERHDWEQHICFLLGSTLVDRQGRSAAHFPVRETWPISIFISQISFSE